MRYITDVHRSAAELPYLIAPVTNNQTERDIIRSFDGWSNFCYSYGLKPTDLDEDEEAKAILRRLAEEDIKAAKAEQRKAGSSSYAQAK